MTTAIDLNSDVGESFGRYRLGMDEEVIALISSANIACGFHAGDPQVMRQTVAKAARHDTAIGAHPGLPDLMGFGRRAMDVSPTEIRDYIIYQVGALQAVAAAQHIKLQHVKAHGALYNMAVARPALWEEMIQAVAALDKDLILFVLAGKHKAQIDEMGRVHGVRIAFEFFADRAYNPDGSLVSRHLEGAVINDHQAAAARVLKMVQHGRVTCADGSEMQMRGDTVCVHGDNPAALNLVRQIRRTLADAGIRIQPVGRFLG